MTRIAQQGQHAFVKLQNSAAGIGQRLDLLPVRRDQVVVELIQRGINRWDEIFAADEGWMYFIPSSMWMDPNTHLYEERIDPRYLYKVRIDGTQRTKLFTVTPYEDYFSVRNGWIYYVDATNKEYAVNRVKEDGSGKQKI
jgi:hypothetical protein